MKDLLLRGGICKVFFILERRIPSKGSIFEDMDLFIRYQDDLILRGGFL